MLSLNMIILSPRATTHMYTLRKNKHGLLIRALLPVDFIHIFQDHFIDTGAIVWLPRYQWSNSDGYG